MNLTLSPAPSRPAALRSFALGPLLHEWSEAFQPGLLSSASQALQAVQSLVQSGLEALDALSASKAAGLFTVEECNAEEQRLTVMLERQVSMIERLGAFHSRCTSVSAAALLHAMTRGDLASGAERITRDVSPRRSLGSASDMIVQEGER